MRPRGLSVLALLLACAPGAQAQQGLPSIMVMTREQFRPGNMPAHNRQIPAFYAFFDKAKVGAPRMGLLPISGDQNHLVYLENYASYAEMEASTKKLDEVMSATPALQAELDSLSKQNEPLHESQSVWVAIRRNDMSYRPRTAAEIAKIRNVSITVTRVNVGRASDYADYVKQTNAAREKLGLDEHSSVWQVTSGAPTGTFLSFVSNSSMAEADAAMRGADARTKKLNEALGGEMVVKQRAKLISELIAQSTSTLYSVNRAISRPAPEYLAADPDFWKPKEAPKPPAKK